MVNDEREERISREAVMLAEWQTILKRKGFNAVNSLLIANQIYQEHFVSRTKEGKPFYNLDAAELYAPVLTAFPWQHFKSKYGQLMPISQDTGQQTVTCPRCKNAMVKVDIAYPNDTTEDGKPRITKAWQCHNCNLVVEDFQLDNLY